VIDAGFWRRRRVLLTGHTGFRGAWLALWLHALGAEVSGFAARPPTASSLSALTRLDEPSTIGDVRDLAAVEEAVRRARPDVVFHLASRAPMNDSLLNPVERFTTNVVGNVNILEGVRNAGGDGVAVVCVTSDKCYVNRVWEWGYRESDELGGDDPYTARKACQELAAASYRRSLLGEQAAVATAPRRKRDRRPRLGPVSPRAGRHAGGARPQVAHDPPPAQRAATAARAQSLFRLPAARRAAGDLGRGLRRGMELLPAVEEARPVAWLVERLRRRWPGELTVEISDVRPAPAKARLVKLDASKARERLGWTPCWPLERAVEGIVAWYEAYSSAVTRVLSRSSR
jgi:CDP-glucose 4,6-dehydratase